MKLFLIALLTGAVSALAFQPVGWWPLMPLALAVLCELIWRSNSLKQALGIGWGFGFGQFLIALNWIATAFTYQAEMPAWLGWIAVVLVALYLAIYPALATGLAWRFKGNAPVALVLTLAGAWPITEWLRGTMFTGFPWNPLGVTLVDTHLLNAATVIGTYGLTILVAFAGGILWLAARQQWRGAGVLLAVLLAMHFMPWPQALAARARNIRVVQPNIGQEDKWRPGFAEQATAKLNQLTAAPGAPPRLVFWPEAAVVEPLEIERIDSPRRAMVALEQSGAVAALGPNDRLVTGGLALVTDGTSRIVGATNSTFVLDRSGTSQQRYDKAHLVPYGEYLPIRPVLTAIGLSKLTPGNIDFVAGPGPRTLDLPGFGRMGVQICYEIIFSGEVVDRRNRPDFIFNPSNDAWFGRWGPPQHLAQARLRAAEEGIPVIRSTPTGISAVIDAHGRIVASLPWRTAGAIDARLPPPAPPTLFARFGNLIPLLLGFALLIGGIAVGRTRR
jgi:apolipoprotein N-acyltransferase